MALDKKHISRKATLETAADEALNLKDSPRKVSGAVLTIGKFKGPFNSNRVSDIIILQIVVITKPTLNISNFFLTIMFVFYSNMLIYCEAF